MADYSTGFARSARKEFERLPADVVDRILGKIGALSKTRDRPASSSFMAKATHGGCALAITEWFIQSRILPGRLTFQ
jgi:hypothetical protein